MRWTSFVLEPRSRKYWISSTAMTSPSPGDVWLADLGLAAKTRPVIVVSRRDPDAPRALVLYVPLTTQGRSSRYEVAIPRVHFLDRESFANIQGLGSIPTKPSDACNVAINQVGFWSGNYGRSMPRCRNLCRRTKLSESQRARNGTEDSGRTAPSRDANQSGTHQP